MKKEDKGMEGFWDAMKEKKIEEEKMKKRKRKEEK